jgi:hypothetical protein
MLVRNIMSVRDTMCIRDTMSVGEIMSVRDIMSAKDTHDVQNPTVQPPRGAHRITQMSAVSILQFNSYIVRIRIYRVIQNDPCVPEKTCS